MLQRFADIAFTASVRDAQRRYAGGEHGGGMAAKPGLGARETEFIAARDSFYLASVGDTGWPYVQHRGGPVGFLKVLAPGTLGFADFGGNRQYVTAGNIEGDPRVCLFLMDYPNRRRLKIFGRARSLDPQSVPELGAQLDAGGGRVERLVVIGVEAFDWNCSQHITPRYSESEWQSRLNPTTPRRSE